jgi:hypothetical protein
MLTHEGRTRAHDLDIVVRAQDLVHLPRELGLAVAQLRLAVALRVRARPLGVAAAEAAAEAYHVYGVEAVEVCAALRAARHVRDARGRHALQGHVLVVRKRLQREAKGQRAVLLQLRCTAQQAWYALLITAVCGQAHWDTSALDATDGASLCTVQGFASPHKLPQVGVQTKGDVAQFLEWPSCAAHKRVQL